MLQDLMNVPKSVSPKEYKDIADHSSIIKANPVPITSKIPMYKQICSEQEHRYVDFDLYISLLDEI